MILRILLNSKKNCAEKTPFICETYSLINVRAALCAVHTSTRRPYMMKRLNKDWCVYTVNPQKFSLMHFFVFQKKKKMKTIHTTICYTILQFVKMFKTKKRNCEVKRREKNISYEYLLKLHVLNGCLHTKMNEWMWMRYFVDVLWNNWLFVFFNAVNFSHWVRLSNLFVISAVEWTWSNRQAKDAYKSMLTN